MLDKSARNVVQGSTVVHIGKRIDERLLLNQLSLKGGGNKLFTHPPKLKSPADEIRVHQNHQNDQTQGEGARHIRTIRTIRPRARGRGTLISKWMSSPRINSAGNVIATSPKLTRMPVTETIAHSSQSRFSKRASCGARRASRLSECRFI